MRSLTNELECSPPSASEHQTVPGIIATMPPITLAEMDAIQLMDRVDTKYLLRAERLRDLLVAVAGYYRVLEVQGLRITPYKTLYFDTPQRDCYHDHHNGRMHRRKYRMRDYGSNGTTFFEVKTKTNKFRTLKRRLEVPAIESTLDCAAAAMAVAESRKPLDLAAQVWTSFSRIALIGCEGIERATIDVDLNFWDVSDRWVSLPGVAIVEVKQPRRSRNSPIVSQLRAMQVAPSRISKYCVGSVLLEPTLKSNLFKATLRTLRLLCH